MRFSKNFGLGLGLGLGLEKIPEDSDFIEDVKNTEPPEYVKQLANTGM